MNNNKYILELEAIESARLAGEKIVFTNGCFDLLHRGHVAYLNKAKDLGDFLVIGLNSDESIRRIKGAQRPINTQEDRKAVLDALKYVDCVIVFEEDTPENLIRAISPAVLVKGADWDVKDIAGAEYVISKGGEVRTIEFVDGISTTIIIERILQTYGSKRV